jgi:Polysaccharide lyase
VVIAAVAAVVAGLLLLGQVKAGRTVFEADFATKRLDAYASVINRDRMAVVEDPVLGPERKVVKMTVRDWDTGPTDDPRGQLETSKFWDDGENYYVGFSVLFGRDWDWRMCESCWVTFHQIYGPPFDGQGPLNMNVKADNPRGEPRITWERTARYGFDHPFEVRLSTMRWYDFVWHVRLSSDPDEGFVEIWMNRGEGWEKLRLNGRERLHMATKIRANGSRREGNSSNIQLYRSRGIADVATMYFADHAVGTSFDAVAPASYD